MDANTILLAAAALLMVWHLLARRKQQLMTVPVVPGLPLLGNVVALGRGGVAFITKCRQRVRVTAASLLRSCCSTPNASQ